MRILLLKLVALFALGICPAAALAGDTQPFIATAVQAMPGQTAQSGKIFVSGQDTRFEFVDHGREVVQVILPKQKLMRIMFPKDRVYMEFQAPKDAPSATPNDATPCPRAEGLTCVKEGVDKYNDIDVERWRLTYQGAEGGSVLWWEPVRKMIVRQEFSDGRIMQLQLAGEVEFDGRKTEHWDISYAAPGAPLARGMRLVDRSLNIIVREQDPSGMVRELRGLQVVKAEAKWFSVPEGYKRIEAPKAGAAAPKPQ